MPLTYESDVIIIGGGPAGMMAGLLFARAGVKTLVLEKHKDFFRDFRGDTVHPSTMEILDQLGLLDEFLKRPHSKIQGVEIAFGGKLYELGDLSHLRTPAPFIAMMPQWDFLDFLRDEAETCPGFTLEMEARVASLIESEGRVTGVEMDDGRRIMARQLVIAADGRDSIVRSDPALPLIELGAPMDIFWFALSKSADEQGGIRGTVDAGKLLVMIDRSTYWQCAFVIPKGSAEAVRKRGIKAFREDVAAMVPGVTTLDRDLKGFAEVKLLTVALERLERWHKQGLLIIGDAAHTMSPIGGIGINLAIQDAVAAANVLAGPLAEGRAADPLLAEVQSRRMWPTRVIQRGQKLAQDNLIQRILTGPAVTRPPFVVRMLDRFPILRRIPGRIVGLGIGRERVQGPSL